MAPLEVVRRFSIVVSVSDNGHKSDAEVPLLQPDHAPVPMPTKHLVYLRGVQPKHPSGHQSCKLVFLGGNGHRATNAINPKEEK